MTDMEKYYEVFLDFLNTVGAHQAIVKLGVNAEEGVYPVQVVVHNYNYRGARLDQEIQERNNWRWKKLNDLDYWGQRVGFLPISPEGKQKVMKFTENIDRRRYIRDNVKRAAKKQELVSIGDLMFKRCDLEKSRRDKKRAKEVDKEAES